MRRVVWCVAVALAMGVATMAAPAAAQESPTATEVFRSDSLAATFAQVSPDGRWVVLRVEEASGGSLWMASTAGGTPFRLTSPGFDDRGAFWFASGDRIAFGSTRPNRNGGGARYPMVLALDPETGRPAGGPRQVGIEPISNLGPPSPDGRWLPYVTADPPFRLKLVPSEGGAARELTRVGARVSGLLFGPDSGHLYYSRDESEGAESRHVLRRIAVAGGEPEVVATGDAPLRILAGDPRFVLHWVGPQAWEVRRLDGTLVGAAELPAGSRTVGQTRDGLGLVGVDEAFTTSVRTVSIDGGPSWVVVEGGRHWPEAWMPDGSALLVDRPADGGAIAVELFPLDGGASRTVRLPAAARASGWESSVGPWFSYRLSAGTRDGVPLDSIVAVNILTGETRTVASAAARGIGLRGRGGAEQDGPRWLFLDRVAAGGLEIRSTDPATGVGGASVPLPADLMPSGVVGVHGDRAAWLQTRGDSLDLLLVTGADPSPRPIGRFSGQASAVTWSWDGTRLAVADALPGTPARGGVWVLSMGGDGTPTGDVRRFDTGHEQGCDQFWWTPDDAHVVMLCYGDGGRIVRLRLRDGQRETLVPSESPQQVWELYLSPDGRRIAYPVQAGAGAAVSVLDLRPLLRR